MLGEEVAIVPLPVSFPASTANVNIFYVLGQSKDT
jgi:hypothetical protein